MAMLNNQRVSPHYKNWRFSHAFPQRPRHFAAHFLAVKLLAIRRAFGDAHHFLPREGLATLVWPVEPVKPPESQVEPSLGGHLEQYQELFFFFSGHAHHHHHPHPHPPQPQPQLNHNHNNQNNHTTTTTTYDHRHNKSILPSPAKRLAQQASATLCAYSHYLLPTMPFLPTNYHTTNW